MKYVKFILIGMTVLLCQTMIAQGSPKPLPSFHAIIFADTQDANIGKSNSH